MDFSTAIDFITKNRKPDSNFLVAIDGRSGSGKTLIAEQIKKQLPDSEIIHLDTFDMYQGDPSTKKVIKEIIEPLKNNPKPGEGIILEGIFALNSDLEPYYDYKIWVECPAEIGFKRGFARDISLNGINNSDKWLRYWIPKEEEYIKTQNPKEKANFVIDGA